MSTKPNVAVVGASGYTGEELLRLLIRHPEVNLSCVTSREYHGKSVADVYPQFPDNTLEFQMPDVDTIAKSADIAFMCLPHGQAIEFAVPLRRKGVRVVDLSADFRLKDTAKYRKYYGLDHPAPDLLAESVYGMPELYRNAIPGAQLIACPGCYPTSVILPVAPLLRSGVAAIEHISICGKSGVSGAGRKLVPGNLYSECNESLRAYSTTGHRHIPEIEQELSAAAASDVSVAFTANLVPMTRGLLSTIFLRAADSTVTRQDIFDQLEQMYAQEPFVRVLAPGVLPNTKNVMRSNRCEIGCDYDERTQTAIVTSAIDNLTKGASGQAVQCMNISLGLKETTGLLQ